MFIQSIILTLIMGLLPICTYASDNNFPLREKFPALTTISSDDLYQRFDEIVIVDVRSRFEYETISIVNAINITHSDKSFGILLDAKVSKDKSVVFYCNGHTCAKSYRAAEDATNFGFKNVYVYDSGIFDWSQSYPKMTVFVDKILDDPNRLDVMKKEFEKDHLIDVETFLKKASLPNAVIIDVREANQRIQESDGAKINIPNLTKKPHYLQLNTLKTLIKFEIFDDLSRNNVLLIYDATGKQIMWLHYYLHELDVNKNLFFLKEGVLGATGNSTID